MRAVACLITTGKRNALLQDKVLPALERELKDPERIAICVEPGSTLETQCRTVAFTDPQLGLVALGLRWQHAYALVEDLPHEYVLHMADDVELEEGFLEKALGWLESRPAGICGFGLYEHRPESAHLTGKRNTYWRNTANKNKFLPEQCKSHRYGHVGNCIASAEVYRRLPPLGLFNRGPDVIWPMAVSQAGYYVLFCPVASGKHYGSYYEHRPNARRK